MFKLFNLFTWVHDLVGYFTFNLGGDPPAPAPTQSTNYTTNIPEYAQPYVMNMMNAAQAQINNPSMTGFNPYVPYSNNPADYVASASPMQQQAYSTAANMRVPSQYGMATRGTLGAMSGLGGVGQQMGNAGANYARMATDPSAIGAYMNPYLRMSLDPQLQLANQQYGIAGQQGQSKAAQQGAFGGTREALMASQNAQNQMLAQNQLIGQGYNKAFDTAQQAQQFGANLGLQGYQGQLQALQSMLGGANQLAGIGGSQLAAQQGIANLQNQYGKEQQGQQQNIINQAVQNYATAQQYPFMQLGLLNSMLRGLPMQQSSTQMYQAPPNPLGQMAGLASTAYGMFGGQGRKSGGVIKAAGGIPMSHYSNDQLAKVQKSPFSTPLAKDVAIGELGVHNYIQANPEAKKLLAPPPMPRPQQVAMMPQNRVGLDNIETNDMTQMAGGGIIAFADTGVVPPAENQVDKFFDLNPKTKEKEFNINKFLYSELGRRPQTGSEAIKEDIKAQEKALGDIEKNRERDKWLNIGQGFLSNTSPFFSVAAGKALESYNKADQETAKDIATRRKDISTSRLSAAEKDQAAYDRILGTTFTAQEMRERAKNALAEQHYKNSLLDQEKSKNDFIKAQGSFNNLYTKLLDNARRVNSDVNNPHAGEKTDDQLMGDAYSAAHKIMFGPNSKFNNVVGIPTPEEFKAGLATYQPGNTVAAPPKKDDGSHWYNPFSWGNSATPAKPAAPAAKPIVGTYNPATGQLE